jgi:hypothetical protein
MEEPLVLQTVPLAQDCTTQALLLQVWYCGLVPAATQTICPLLLEEQVEEPVGADVAEVVVFTVVVFEEVVLDALVAVPDVLIVLEALDVEEALVVVLPGSPLQVPVLIDATTLRSSPLSLETSQTIAPAKPLHKA